MGLDMYAFTTKQRPDSSVDFHLPGAMHEIHYWRKHPNLHGWMEALYSRKGGQDRDFNMSPLMLDAADLDALEHAIKKRVLPETSGFFFGHSDGQEDDDDLAFVAKARAAISSGLTVFYLAWW